MAYKLTVSNSGMTYGAEPGETMLDALLRNGVRVRYGCRRGKCSSCKHLVVDGEYDNSDTSAYALLEEERERGMTLLCRTYPQSDCTLELLVEAGDEDGVKLSAPRVIQGRVTDVTPAAPSLLTVSLELEERLRFLPGQYLEIGVPGRPTTTRTYSIASPPRAVRRPQLLVRQYGDGAFSSGLLDIAPDQAIEVQGPYGSMYLRPTVRPIVLVGYAEGIAPMLSIVRHFGTRRHSAPMSVFHGAPSADELAYRAELSAWSAAHSCRSYVAIDEEEPRPGRIAARALTKALNDQIAPGSDIDVYIAGPAIFCDHVIFILEARGLPPAQLHAERFFPAQREDA